MLAVLAGIFLMSPKSRAQQIESVVYKKAGDVALKMYIIRPEKQAKTKAALVLFHGGGWNQGKPQLLFKHGKYFAGRGMVVFVPQYRLRKINGTTILEAVEDAKDAVGWVREHAKEYDIDPAKIAVGGGSAGGHLACMTAMNQTVKSRYPEKTYRPDILTLFNPVLDISKEGYGHFKVVEELKNTPVRWQELSPLHSVKPGLPPVLVMVGDHDKILPKPTALRFEKEMKQAGNDCVVKIYPGGEHTFFNFGYAKKKGYPKGTPNRYYYETLQDMDNFLYQHGFLDDPAEIEIPENAVYPIQKD